MKIFKLLLTVLLLLSVALTFISCDDKDSGSTTTSGSSTTTSGSQAVDLTTKSQTSDLNRISFGGASFVKPEGYTQKQENGMLNFYPPDYSVTNNNIVINSGSDRIADYTQSILESKLKSSFESLGYDVNISNISIEKSKYNGYDCAVISYKLDLSGLVTLYQKQFALFFGGKSLHFTLTYNDNSDNILNEFKTLTDSIIVD